MSIDNPEKTYEEELGTETEDIDTDIDAPVEEEEIEEEETEEETPEEEVDPALQKFKGKTEEELIEMYRNLETRIEKEAIRKAQAMLGKGGRPEGKGQTKDDLLEEIETMDFSKMSPKEFASWILTNIEARAVKKAQETYDQSSKVKTAVERDIRETTKTHPHLKENKEYREIVISIIEAAAARNETITLKQACEKADKALNITKPVEKPAVKKRTGVEKPAGTDSQPSMTDEERVKQGILGGGTKSGLGGLGI